MPITIARSCRFGRLRGLILAQILQGLPSHLPRYNPLAIGDRRGKTAGDIAQGHIGDRGIQDFHQGGHHYGERDQPRIKDPWAGRQRDRGRGWQAIRRSLPSRRGAGRLGRFLEKFACVRACRSSSQIYRRGNRETDEKWHLVRIIVQHVDPYRQAAAPRMSLPRWTEAGMANRVQAAMAANPQESHSLRIDELIAG